MGGLTTMVHSRLLHLRLKGSGKSVVVDQELPEGYSYTMGQHNYKDIALLLYNKALAQRKSPK